MLIVLFEDHKGLADTAFEGVQEAQAYSKALPRVVRAASLGDRNVVTRMLGAAFQDDPVMSFIFPDPDVRRARMPRLFAIAYDLDEATGARFMTNGGEAAALWRAPGHVRLSLCEKITVGVPWLAAVGCAFSRALAVSVASDANRPAEPHWYLDVTGCAPEAQGRGFGGAAIRAGLARADADGVASYVETANETNLEIYRALGFAVTHCWRVPNGPAHWSLLRSPQT